MNTSVPQKTPPKNVKLATKLRPSKNSSQSVQYESIRVGEYQDPLLNISLDDEEDEKGRATNYENEDEENFLCHVTEAQMFRFTGDINNTSKTDSFDNSSMTTTPKAPKKKRK